MIEQCSILNEHDEIFKLNKISSELEVKIANGKPKKEECTFICLSKRKIIFEFSG